jgi:uncharacterized protein with HEPN domain
MAKPASKTQDAYLHDMLEAAQLIRGYMAGVSFKDFWHNSEKRDAVALRISVLGESAHKIDKATESALSGIPFKSIRGMRNRLAHDYGAVDFKIVWAVTQQEIEPLIAALEAYFKQHPPTNENQPGGEGAGPSVG